MSKKQIDLGAPLEGGSGRPAGLSFIELREPTLGEVRHALTVLKPGHGMAELRRYQIMLVAKVAGISEKQAERLPIGKLNAATLYLQGFIDKSDFPQSGEPQLLLAVDPPITLNNVTLNDLYLREPTGAEMAEAEAHLRGQFGAYQTKNYEMTLVAKVAGVSPALINMLPISTFNEAFKFVENFSLAGQETGEG